MTEARETYAVGEGVSWGEGSDTCAGTVVAVTKSTVTVVEDRSELLNGESSGEPDALRVQVGGYAGHTSGKQRYRYEYDRNGAVRKFSWRRRQQRYKLAGTSTVGSMQGWGLLFAGRHRHYDFNF